MKRAVRVCLIALMTFALAGFGGLGTMTLAGTTGPGDPDMGAAPTVLLLAGTTGPGDPDMG